MILRRCPALGAHGVNPCISRALLVLMIVLTVCDGQYAIAQPARPPGEQTDLLARFQAEYPKSVLRLQSAIENIRGTWRYRESSAQNSPGRWFDVRFYRSGEMIRFDRSLSSGEKTEPGDAAAQNIGFLIERFLAY